MDCDAHRSITADRSYIDVPSPVPHGADPEEHRSAGDDRECEPPCNDTAMLEPVDQETVLDAPMGDEPPCTDGHMPAPVTQDTLLDTPMPDEPPCKETDQPEQCHRGTACDKTPRLDPPYKEGDRPEDGLLCYQDQCTYVCYSWAAMMKHLQLQHCITRASLKRSFLYEAALAEHKRIRRMR